MNIKYRFHMLEFASIALSNNNVDICDVFHLVKEDGSTEFAELVIEETKTLDAYVNLYGDPYKDYQIG
jgi:hypothetical protein